MGRTIVQNSVRDMELLGKWGRRLVKYRCNQASFYTVGLDIDGSINITACNNEDSRLFRACGLDRGSICGKWFVFILFFFAKHRRSVESFEGQLSPYERTVVFKCRC